MTATDARPLTLGIDTAIGTAVALVAADGTPLWQESVADTRRHAELLGPLLARARQSAEAVGASIGLVAVGMGPGPFTGLRVGIAAARAFAFGAGIPVIGVVSHDAAAAALAEVGGIAEGEVVLLHSDARRKERYGARYRGVRSAGSPGATAAAAPGEGRGTGADRADAVRDGDPFLLTIAEIEALASPGAHADAADRLIEIDAVSAAHVAVLGAALRASGDPGVDQALYLRSPDVTLAPAKGVRG